MREEVLVVPNSLVSYIIGGIPRDQLTVLMGLAGGGKTTFVANLVHWFKDSGFYVIVLDAERSVGVRLRDLGLEGDVDYYEVPVSLEDAFKLQFDLVLGLEGDKDGLKGLKERGIELRRPLVLFWDTITATPFRSELKILRGALEDLTERDFPVGLFAQVFSSLLKVLVPRLKDLTLVYVSQVRAKISFGSNTSVVDMPGGMALKHYAASIIDFKQAGLEDDGQWVRLKLVKSKYFPPKSGEVYMSFSRGFDERISLVKALVRRVWKKERGGWIKLGDRSYTERMLLEKVNEDDELWMLINKKMKEEEVSVEKMIG